MAKYHNGPNGPGPCSASKGNCPFGGEENHYGSKEEAAKAYEKKMADGSVMQSVRRLPTASQSTIRDVGRMDEGEILRIDQDGNSHDSSCDDYIGILTRNEYGEFDYSDCDGSWRAADDVLCGKSVIDKSELSGAIAERIATTPGMYALAEVYAEDGDGYGDSLGWTVLRKADSGRLEISDRDWEPLESTMDNFRSPTLYKAMSVNEYGELEESDAKVDGTVVIGEWSGYSMDMDDDSWEPVTSSGGVVQTFYEYDEPDDDVLEEVASTPGTYAVVNVKQKVYDPDTDETYIEDTSDMYAIVRKRQ